MLTNEIQERINNGKQAIEYLRFFADTAMQKETQNNLLNCISAYNNLIHIVKILSTKNQELKTWCDELISENRRLKEDKLTPFKHDILNDLSETLCDSIQGIIESYKEN